MAHQSVGIIGAGAWGTALAIVARRAGRDVLVWAHEPETISAINDQHCNEVFLPGVPLDPAIEATDRLSEAATCDMLLMVTPALQYFMPNLPGFNMLGAGLVMGCDHPNLDQTVQVSEEVRKSLVGDLH